MRLSLVWMTGEGGEQRETKKREEGGEREEKGEGLKEQINNQLISRSICQSVNQLFVFFLKASGRSIPT